MLRTVVFKNRQKLIFIYLAHARTCTHPCVTRTTLESWFSPPCGARDQTQVFRPGSRGVYPLSNLTAPTGSLLSDSSDSVDSSEGKLDPHSQHACIVVFSALR